MIRAIPLRPYAPPVRPARREHRHECGHTDRCECDDAPVTPCGICLLQRYNAGLPLRGKAAQ